MKKPLLGPCDSFQLEPFEYEWAWQMSRECEHNTWTPEEIPVAQDVQVYKAPDLNPAAKHLFEAVMAQLTTFDIQRGDDAAETFLSILQPAEIKHFLKRLVWEEALHTRSYRYIIENLGIPLEIYDRWQTVPSMHLRVKYAEEFNEGLLQIMFEQFDMGGAFVNDQKAFILKAMIFWFLIFEGVWFWLNLLGPVQALARQGMFKGAAEQLQYIARDECLIEGTEILTPTGWLPVEQVSMETVLAQWDIDGTISWAQPLALSTHKATDAYSFDLKSRGFSQIVSRQHRIPYYTKHGNLKVVGAVSARPNPYSSHPVAGLLSNIGTPMLSSLERFQIALQADGSLPSNKHTGERSGRRPFSFTFTKQRKITEFEELLALLRWDWVKSPDSVGRTRYTVFVPVDIQVSKCFQDWVDLENKSLPWVQHFIEEVAKWDSHISKDNPARIIYSSTDKSNVDVVQAAAALCGCRTKYTRVIDGRKNSYKDIHRLFINRHQTVVQGGRIEKRRMTGDFTFYGIQVPSSFLVIRHDNCVSITGNSQHIRFGVELIRAFISQHVEVVTESFQRDVTRMFEQCIQLEADYANYCHSAGSILGYSVLDHVETARYFANMRMRSIGFPEPFPGAEHKFPWMAEQLELKKEKNFFETRVTDYRTGGALTFEIQVPIEEISNWLEYEKEMQKNA